jgi:hypothetical protein
MMIFRKKKDDTAATPGRHWAPDPPPVAPPPVVTVLDRLMHFRSEKILELAVLDQQRARIEVDLEDVAGEIQYFERHPEAPAIIERVRKRFDLPMGRLKDVADRAARHLPDPDPLSR